MKPKLSILFVCMGNICRSPTAEAVFRSLVKRSSFDESRVYIDSAGTTAHHAGESPDPRSIIAGEKRSYDLTKITARQVTDSDFDQFDLLIAMDNENYTNLVNQAKACNKSDRIDRIKLFLDYSSQDKYKEVPDPYYGAGNGFDLVIDLIEDASNGLLRSIE